MSYLPNGSNDKNKNDIYIINKDWNMREPVRNIQCTIPSSDLAIFKRFADGMGWSYDTIPAKKNSTKRINKAKASDIEFVMSIHAEGGGPVPTDENPNDALAELKYL